MALELREERQGPPQAREEKSAREGAGGPGCLGGGAVPAGGKQPLGQWLCSRPGPSVLQQEVGGHIQVIVRSSQGF